MKRLWLIGLLPLIAQEFENFQIVKPEDLLAVSELAQSRLEQAEICQVKTYQSYLQAVGDIYFLREGAIDSDLFQVFADFGEYGLFETAALGEVSAKEILYIKSNEQFSGLFTADDRIVNLDQYPMQQLNAHWFFIVEKNQHLEERNRTILIHLNEGWKSKEIPKTYAQHRMLIDCLIEPSSSLYLENQELENREKMRSPEGEVLWADIGKVPYPPSLDYAHVDSEKLTRPERIDFWKQREEFESDYFDALFGDPKNLAALKAQMIGSRYRGYEESKLYELGMKYGLEEDAYKLLRSAPYRSMCGNDNGRARQVRRIISHAAQNQDWDRFLMGYLSLMKDPFDRFLTYQKEMEESEPANELIQLGLPLEEMIQGLLLGVSSYPQRIGIWRISRVTRGYDGPELEAALLDMVEDPELDLVNRSRALYLIIYRWHFLFGSEAESILADYVIGLEPALEVFAMRLIKDPY